MNRSQRRAGSFLAGLGIFMILAEVAPAIGAFRYIFNIQEHYDINPWIVLIAAAIGFVGFFILDGPRAIQGGDYLIDSFERITHGREGDPPNTTVSRKTTVIAPKPPETDAGN